MGLDFAIFYARAQFKSTALSSNVAQSVSVLTAAGYRAQGVALGDLCATQGPWVWRPWLEANQPRVVILSAFIVPPVDVGHLAETWPQITWVQRCHSNLLWLFSTCGDMARCLQFLELTRQRENLVYAVVSQEEARRFQAAGLEVTAVPNVLAKQVARRARRGVRGEELHLSAMFALRALKHPAGHVLAAATVARRHPVVLHMQTERTDAPAFGESLKRLANAAGLRLAVEPYRDHEEFEAWLDDTVDIGLQLSATESFNYVTLEHFSRGIPVVASRAISWSPWQVDCEDTVAAAEMVLGIVDRYGEASELALDTAWRVQAQQREEFLEACSNLLSRR